MISPKTQKHIHTLDMETSNQLGNSKSENDKNFWVYGNGEHTKGKTIGSHQGFIDKDYSNRCDNIEHP